MSDSYRTSSNIYPSLSYADPIAAIAWLEDTFGFTRRLVVPGPDGTVMHSELSLGEVVIMIGSPREEAGRMSPKQLNGVSVALSIHIDDPDAHYANAKAAGAEIIAELADADFGSRGYMAKDLEGHLWYFGTYRPGEHWDKNDTP